MIDVLQDGAGATNLRTHLTALGPRVFPTANSYEANVTDERN
ncbi:hypothetical protein ACX9NE_13935 [Mycobacterium sp. ML4]